MKFLKIYIQASKKLVETKYITWLNSFVAVDYSLKVEEHKVKRTLWAVNPRKATGQVLWHY